MVRQNNIMDYYLSISHMSLEDLLKLFNIEMNDESFYETIAFNLVQKYHLELIVLFERFDHKRKKAILIALRDCSKNKKIKKFLLSKLNQLDGDLQIVIIDTLSYFKFSDYSIFNSYLHESNIDLQCAMIRFFSRQKGGDFKTELINFLQHPDSRIKENAIDQLDELEESSEEHIRTLKYLVPLLHDNDGNIVEIVKDILMRNIYIYKLDKNQYFLC